MTAQETRPLIVGFVADLMFTPRIANAARGLNYEVKWIEAPASLGDIKEENVDEPLGESLFGYEGALFDKITAWQPSLLLFDLNNKAIPWQRWIPLLKSSPATRRIPILCFGSHKDVAAMTTATNGGADAVLARSRFTAAMPQLLQQYAKQAEPDALDDACAAPLPPLARQGIEKFNAGNYYACHDDLEEAWMQDGSPGRNLYRAILQVGIALYQVERGNYRGAVKMLLRVRQWLAPLPAICRSVNVARLRDNAETIYDELIKLGEDQIAAFDWQLVASIEMTE